MAPALKAASERRSHSFYLETGQGYLIDNHRWLHVRDAYEGFTVIAPGRPDGWYLTPATS